MFKLPVSFTSGASFIKKNSVVFKADCLELSRVVTNPEVKQQLIAAANAGVGKCNTGLSEKGWRGLAELIGMVSPTSDKLIIPADAVPAEFKQEVMLHWLVTGQYTSSRTDGKGGSKAIKDSATLYMLGLTAKNDRKLKQAVANLRQLREIPETVEVDMEAGL